MGLVQLFGKSRKLRSISKVLAESNQDSAEQTKAEEELFDLCFVDEKNQMVLEMHHADKETLKTLYRRILVLGADQWVEKDYVAASALAFPTTLEYLLRNKDRLTTSDERGREITAKVVSYFTNNFRLDLKENKAPKK